MSNTPREIRAWARHCLAERSDHYGGLPPCPYAEPAFQRGEVSIIVTDRLGRVAQIKQDIPPQGNHTYVIAWTNPGSMTPAQLDRWMGQQNEQHHGIWLMGFHPDAEAEEGIADMPIEIESDYAVILMQRLETVVSASRVLAKSGYYQGYSNADWQEITRRDECAKSQPQREPLAAHSPADLSASE